MASSAASDPILTLSPGGLFCRAGGFHIDPWGQVPDTFITHAHGDHIFPGCRTYRTAAAGAEVLKTRLEPGATIETMAYGEVRRFNGVAVSLHPAGHILGSSQVRLEQDGHVTVVTGDMKREADPTCAPFEVVPCDDLYLDATFSLPVYRWPDPGAVIADINAWWSDCRRAKKSCLVFAYALGKAQRVLSGLSGGPILAHGAVLRMIEAYRASGVALPEVLPATDENAKAFRGEAMVLAPPSAQNTVWMRKFAPLETGFVSGWMIVRGAKRRRNVDRGFVMSDHCDWPSLLRTVKETGAKRVHVMHGPPGTLSRYLSENGVAADDVPHRGNADATVSSLAAEEAGA